MARKKVKRKMTNKQALITILCIAAAAVLLIGALVVIGIINKDVVTDPHAGHNHAPGEGHEETSATVKYQVYQEEGGTYRLVFRDGKGVTLAEHKGLTKQPIKTAIDETKGVYELGWATDNGPNDFACVYYNEKTGQVSEKFTAPRGTDGVRIAYGSADQKSVIVEGLFDGDDYHKEYALKNAAADKNGDIILGGTLQSNKKSVTVTYHVDPSVSEDSQYITINLYD